MGEKAASRLNNEIARWNSQETAKVVPAKREEQELDSINNTSKRKRKRMPSVRIRNSQPLDVSLTPKPEDPDTLLVQKDIPENSIAEVSHGSEVMWRGNDVGIEAKKLFEAIELRYPNTFLGVEISVDDFWKNNLKALHLAITRFLGSSVDALTEEEIISLRKHFKDLGLLRFDLSWVHERLDMVARLKFEKKELIALEDSLGPLKEKVDDELKEWEKAYKKWQKATSEYEDATKALNKRNAEMVLEFGQDFDHVLKDRLGAGMLPGY